MWASRWDTYLAMSDVQIHWFAIVNSVVIVLFLSGEFFFLHLRSFICIKRGFGAALTFCTKKVKNPCKINKN